MTDSLDKSRKLRTFADDIQKRDQWLKTWFLIFSGFASINTVMVIAAKLRSPPPHNEAAFFYMVLSAALAAYLAYQRRQLNKFKARHLPPTPGKPTQPDNLSTPTIKDAT